MNAHILFFGVLGLFLAVGNAVPLHPNCDNVRCTVPECSDGILMTLSGECCQRCIPMSTLDRWLCEFIPCDDPQCLPHEKLVTPDGACCPECRHDCSNVACDDPLCRHGLEPYKSCCPTCLDFAMPMEAQNTLAVGNAVPNCDSVRCTVPECSDGILMTLSGECCQRCIPMSTLDRWLCEFIPCDEPQCLPHEKPVTPDGACCPECRHDCSNVACDDPLCRHGLEPYKSCCPTCLDSLMPMKAQNTLAVGNAVPNCDSVRCTVPECSDGILMTLSGECCQRCIPMSTLDRWLCEFIPCDEPQCLPHEKPVTPDGACCPECRHDCSNVACDDPLCRHGLEPYKSCCPTCLDSLMPMEAQKTAAIQDCSNAVCDLPSCKTHQVVVTNNNECCPTCRDIQTLIETQNTHDCSKVICNVPLCEPDHEYFTLEGECCPTCRPIVRQNCDGVRCPFTPCERGQTIFFPEGECCPHCIDFPVDCRAKRCSRPSCGPGQELFTPGDQCCPICRDVTPDCSDATCYTPRCSSDQVFSPEGFCCPQCRNTFTDLFCRDIPSTCSIPPCGYGQTTSALERECCNHGRCCPNSCRQAPTENCAAISCYPLRECEDTYTLEGECCPRCRNIPLIDCGYVRCSLPECDVGQELATTLGQCCPTCHDIPHTAPPNCDATVCPEVWCNQEKEKDCPQDECCCRCR